MFEKLRDDLRSALNKIVKASDINEELIDSLCRDIQRALLLSDVKVTLVKSITDTLKDRALREQPPKGLSRKDHIVTILYGELAKMLGYSGEVIQSIDKTQEDGQSAATSFFKPGKTNVVLMLGIQGSGKTTVTGKLSRWLTKHGYRVGVVGADTWRPGALTQLKMNCSRINVEVYGEEQNKDAVAIAKNGLEHFKGQNLDVVIIDTAGRHKEEEGLLQEMNDMYKVATPELVHSSRPKLSTRQPRSEASSSQNWTEPPKAAEHLRPPQQLEPRSCLSGPAKGLMTWSSFRPPALSAGCLAWATSRRFLKWPRA
jgi:signal recognition particle subunit SRP54